MRIVRFRKGSPPYTAGEIAGFRPEVADRLVSSGVAEVYDHAATAPRRPKASGKGKAPSPEAGKDTPPAPTPTPTPTPALTDDQPARQKEETGAAEDGTGTTDTSAGEPTGEAGGENGDEAGSDAGSEDDGGENGGASESAQGEHGNMPQGYSFREVGGGWMKAYTPDGKQIGKAVRTEDEARALIDAYVKGDGG